jgi:hypothetical protein
MVYSVHFRVDLAEVPESARAEIQRTMSDISDALATVPASSPFWSSMKDSLLQIDVKGFRVVYRVDRSHHDIQVVELATIRH